MTLDFVRLAERMEDLVGAIARETEHKQQRLEQGRLLLSRLENAKLERAVCDAQNANWLTALPDEPLGTVRDAPAMPPGYAAVATDGSSIDVSRHAPAACYVINIGHAWLDYARGEVDLASMPELEHSSDHLLRGDHANASKESAMTGNLLDAYRTAREFLHLAELAELHSEARPLLALLDGQFVIWGIKETELSSAAKAAIFDDGVLLALDRLYEMSGDGDLTLASYISRPAGREVTNALRLAACPRPGGVNCRECPRQDDASRPCDDVAGGVDADLFRGYLAEGQRSAIFRRHPGSSDLVHADDRYELSGHGLRFFYLHVRGGEIARVELPQWTAANAAAVDFVHAAILDQCERGNGYPVVLQEAHEQAVIDGGDRRSFTALIERELELQGNLAPASGKSWSKRRREI